MQYHPIQSFINLGPVRSIYTQQDMLLKKPNWQFLILFSSVQFQTGFDKLLNHNTVSLLPNRSPVVRNFLAKCSTKDPLCVLACLVQCIEPFLVLTNENIFH